jgi:hypothetical protein
VNKSQQESQRIVLEVPSAIQATSEEAPYLRQGNITRKEIESFISEIRKKYHECIVKSLGKAGQAKVSQAEIKLRTKTAVIMAKNWVGMCKLCSREGQTVHRRDELSCVVYTDNKGLEYWYTSERANNAKATRRVPKGDKNIADYLRIGLLNRRELHSL